ncbi:hypothetical protein [Pinirhizobacter sp.]|uniref:hypothetical protein n=1 Tax=Pinirhizobacter sp. TaxID=2950432 RepID=UPI002F400CD6
MPVVQKFIAPSNQPTSVPHQHAIAAPRPSLVANANDQQARPARRGGESIPQSTSKTCCDAGGSWLHDQWPGSRVILKDNPLTEQELAALDALNQVIEEHAVDSTTDDFMDQRQATYLNLAKSGFGNTLRNAHKTQMRLLVAQKDRFV